MAKASLITSAFDAANNVLTLSVAGVGSIDVAIRDLSDDIVSRALVHGLTQKISDAAAMPKADLPDDPTEAAKTKFEAMKAVADRISGPDGEWTKRNGDGSGPVAGIIYRAFEQWAMERAKKAKKSITPEEIRAVYDAKDRAGQLALKTVPEIAAIMERIKAERGPAKSAVDADALMGELGI